VAGSALFQVAVISVLGIGASWIASRLGLPSILLLLFAGFLAGPITGWVKPGVLFGDLLSPFVGLSVAIILFEGGLSLRTVELDDIGTPVRNLVTLGVLVTWAILAAAAYLFVQLPLNVALLLGAILTVTGPTVIIPLLRQIRPKQPVGNLLKWEGILIDPIGVILAVLVFEAILAGGFQEATQVVAITIGQSLIAGFVIGGIGAFATYLLLKRHWVDDHLESPVTLGMVVAVFTACELIQVESGLVGATVMGAVLANQGDVAKRHIVEFKENLRVLLISFLFIVLAARLEPSALEIVGPGSLAFLVVLFVVARPVAVLLSTIGTDLDWSQRAFLSSMAPRGIVAASIASVFALELEEAGVPGGDELVSLAFLAIVATVGVYGLAAGPLSRWLDIGDPDPQGILIVGAHEWSRDLALELRKTGIPVLLMDSNERRLRVAREMGLDTVYGQSVTEHVLEETDFSGIGHFLAMTPNDETNQLTVLNFREVFDRSRTFQLAPETDPGDLATDLTGRILFADDLTYTEFERLLDEGWEIQTTQVPPDAGQGMLEVIRDNGHRPLIVVDNEGRTHPLTPEEPFSPEPGDWIVHIAPGGAEIVNPSAGQT
jgi:NhaP-type Na+/H+ or K+/H+ antiporter